MSQRFMSFRWHLLLLLILWGPSAWSVTVKDRKTLALPYVAVGGAPEHLHLLTVLILTNSSSDADSGTIDFFDDDGKRLPVALNKDSELTAIAPWSVPAGESKVVVISHPGDRLRLGWLKINHSENSTLHVITVIRLFNSQDLIAEAGVQASVEQRAHPGSYKTAAAREPPTDVRDGGVFQGNWKLSSCSGAVQLVFPKTRRDARASQLNIMGKFVGPEIIANEAGQDSRS